jgi:hypothetical protein
MRWPASDASSRPVGHNGLVNRVNAIARGCAAMTVVVVAAAVSSGCTSTVAGVAVRDVNAAPIDVPLLKESQLDGVLLSLGQLNGIVGASKLKFVIDSKEMSDNSAAVSDPDCLGSMFGAEEQVYGDSQWTAVRDQVAREPGDDNDHWVEQTAVLYPSEDQAKQFVEDSTSAWRRCGGFSVAVDDDATSSIWLIDDVNVTDDVVTQMIAQEDSDGWECQHAITSVANLTVESLACAFGISDEAVTMTQKLVANAAK